MNEYLKLRRATGYSPGRFQLYNDIILPIKYLSNCRFKKPLAFFIRKKMLKFIKR